MHDSRTMHVDAVYPYLRYLKSAPGKRTLFSRHGHLRLQVFTEAEAKGGSVDDWLSTSSYDTFLGGNLLTWRIKNQYVMVKSSAKMNTRLWLIAFVSLGGSKSS